MKRKKKSYPIPVWQSPTTEPKFKIGDRVKLNRPSSAIPSHAIGTIYGVIYKSEEIHQGFSDDINFDGYISHHTISEKLLVESVES